MSNHLSILKTFTLLVILTEGFWLISGLLSVVGINFYSLFGGVPYSLVNALSHVVQIGFLVYLLKVLNDLTVGDDSDDTP